MTHQERVGFLILAAIQLVCSAAIFGLLEVIRP